MARTSALLLLFCALRVVGGQDNLLPPYATLSLSLDGGATFPTSSLAQVATFGGSLDAAAAAAPRGLSLLLAPDAFGCAALPAAPPLPPNTALLASRGNCSFTAKAAAAQAAGAAALLVYDGLPGKYLAAQAAGAPLAVGACDLDCGAFAASLPAARAALPEALGGYPDLCSASASGGACASGLCGLAPPAPGAPPAAPRALCCLPNDYLLLGGGSRGPGGEALGIAVAWLSAGDGGALAARARAPGAPAALRVRPALRPLPAWDASGLLLWALGTACAAVASYAAAAPERLALAARRRRSGSGGAAAAAAAAAPQAQGVWGGGTPSETLELTPSSACALLAAASAFLGALYLLSTWGVPIVYFVIALFCVGSVGALSSVLLLPALHWAAWRWCSRAPRGGDGAGSGDAGAQPWLLALRLPLPPLCATLLGAPASLPALPAAAQALAAAAVATWLALRHAPGAWAAQNIFGACLTILAVAQLRLPSLRSAALLLAALFVYDVAMVFGTPLVLRSGESVMVEVATAGAPAPIPAGTPTPACYCRLHPENGAVCGPGERMPILFAWPRLGDWRGGYGMLGLGDIVVPALALAVALRFEYARRGGGAAGQRSAGGAGDAGGQGEEAVSLLGAQEQAEPEAAAGAAAVAAGAAAGASGAAGQGSAARQRSASPRRRAVSPDGGGQLGEQLPPPLPQLYAQPQAPSAASCGRRCLRACARPSLWHVGVLGYGVGLALAQVAVVAMQLGQPALLYLVPCVLLPVAGVAGARGQLAALWKGPPAGEGGAGEGGGGSAPAAGAAAVGAGAGAAEEASFSASP